MEIVNTILGSEISNPTWFFWVNLVVLVIGICLVTVGIEESTAPIGVFLSGALILLLALLLFFLPFHWEKTGEYKPDRYEVILTDPNYVIDATRYKFIDKRGEIIVLEEVQE